MDDFLASLSELPTVPAARNMIRLSLSPIPFVWFSTLFLVACANHAPKHAPIARKKVPVAGVPVPQPYWRAEGASGPARIVIALGAQRAYFYKGKKQVGETHISTGRKGFETPPGIYKVIQKDKDHV